MDLDEEIRAWSGIGDLFPEPLKNGMVDLYLEGRGVDSAASVAGAVVDGCLGVRL